MTDDRKCTIGSFLILCILEIFTRLPLHNFFPFSTINFIYLLTAFVFCGFTGHIKGMNLLLFVKISNPSFRSDIFSRNEFLVFFKVSQPNWKFYSVSMNWLLADLVWQNTHKRLLNGGNRLWRISVAREWALIRRRVKADLWFLLRTKTRHGSAAKHDLKVL